MATYNIMYSIVCEVFLSVSVQFKEDFDPPSLSHMLFINGTVNDS
jgi:hypothetical protein